MTTLQATHKKLLKKYPRALIHMRSQLKLNRFSLVFGAGLSKPFGLPNWQKLVEEIAGDPDVDGKKILERTSRGSLPYKTELLFQHFRAREASRASSGDPALGSPEFESKSLARWFEICKRHLYKSAKSAKSPSDFKKALEKHAYLPKFLPIIKEMPITITYNFDNFIERALFASKDPKDTTLGYETITNPWTQFRRRDGVIYHPHGILPEELMDFPRDRLVFSESEYAKLFLGSLVGDFSFLLNHMSKNTCVIVGSSLEDEDLRNVLTQSAQSNPGNPHYYVHFLEPRGAISPAEAKAIRRANFHVYNLITLFLSEQEIAALADLLYCGFIEDCEFADRLVESDGRATYHFYLSGALGVGKSTTTTQLRNLTVLDEWAEPRLPLLAKPWDELTRAEEEEVNDWIVNQFRIKNDRLRHEKFGIALVDRPPMDPLTFTPPGERPAKAKALLDTISYSGTWDIADGVVILLTGDPQELAARVLATGRDGYSAKKLDQMEKDLRSVYNGDGVTVVETRGKSVAEVTRRVSEIIHFDDYKPFIFAERLRAYKPGSKKTKPGRK